jgi:hypothetical protein
MIFMATNTCFPVIVPEGDAPGALLSGPAKTCVVSEDLLAAKARSTWP